MCIEGIDTLKRLPGETIRRPNLNHPHNQVRDIRSMETRNQLTFRKELDPGQEETGAARVH